MVLLMLQILFKYISLKYTMAWHDLFLDALMNYFFSDWSICFLHCNRLFLFISEALKLWWNGSSCRTVTCPSVTDCWKRENGGRDLVLSISCWLDFEMRAWHLGAGLKQTTWLEKSCTRHQREVCRLHWKIQFLHD